MKLILWRNIDMYSDLFYTHSLSLTDKLAIRPPPSSKRITTAPSTLRLLHFKKSVS